jgi:surface antigen
MTKIYRSYRIICLAAGLTSFLLSGFAQTASAHHKSTSIVIGVASGGNSGRHLDKQRFRNRHNNHRDDYRRYNSNSRHSYPTYYRRGFDYPAYYKRDHYRRDDDTVQLIATATGGVFGALIVSELIHNMNDVDRLQVNQANVTARSTPIGRQITWNNPQSSNAGSIIATRDGYSESGKYCREFYQTVSIGGNTEDAYGVACRQPDGSWQIVQQ